MLRAPCMNCQYRRGQTCPYEIITDCGRWQEFEKEKEKRYYSQAHHAPDEYRVEYIVKHKAKRRKH